MEGAHLTSRGSDMDVRLAAGGVEEQIDVTGVGLVAARYERCPAGWQATFTLGLTDTPDLGIVHRLVAPTLREARRAVPAAVTFLLGHPADDGFGR